jgi:hypothetical protein
MSETESNRFERIDQRFETAFSMRNAYGEYRILTFLRSFLGVATRYAYHFLLLLPLLGLSLVGSSLVVGVDPQSVLGTVVEAGAGWLATVVSDGVLLSVALTGLYSLSLLKYRATDVEGYIDEDNTPYYWEAWEQGWWWVSYAVLPATYLGIIYFESFFGILGEQWILAALVSIGALAFAGLPVMFVFSYRYMDYFEHASVTGYTVSLMVAPVVVGMMYLSSMAVEHLTMSSGAEAAFLFHLAAMWWMARYVRVTVYEDWAAFGILEQVSISPSVTVSPMNGIVALAQIPVWLSTCLYLMTSGLSVTLLALSTAPAVVFVGYLVVRALLNGSMKAVAEGKESAPGMALHERKRDAGELDDEEVEIIKRCAHEEFDPDWLDQYGS